MIACPDCGAENRTSARFCLTCGAGLPFAPIGEVAVAGEPPVTEDAREEPSAAAEPMIGHLTDPCASVSPDQEPETEGVLIPEDPVDSAAALVDDAPHHYEEQESQEPTSAVAVEPSPPEEVAPLPEPEHETAQSILPPLETGKRLCQDRYEIAAVLEETPETILYDAIDHGRCPLCGYFETLPGDVYCARCGVSLLSPSQAPHIRLRSLRMAGEAVIQLEEETDGGIENWFEAEGRLYAVLGPQSAPSDAPDDVHNAGPIRGGLRHVVAYRSHPGLIRDINEDATLAITFAPVLQNNCQPCLGLYAVADGMGGHASGEVASRTAIEGLARVIVQRLFLPELGGEVVLPETPPAVLQEAVQEINQAICQLQESSASDMGTTLTAAVVRDKSVLVANVGDSRTYLWHGGELIQLTADHSLVAQLVAAGAIEPDQIYHHPEKSAIFRSLGHAAEVEVDLFVQTLEAGDRLLLCSDGVWEMLRPDGIEEVLLLEADPQRACDEIVRRSNLAGGEDNISVVIVLFEALVA